MVLGVIMAGEVAESSSFPLRWDCCEGEVGINSDIEWVGGAVFGSEESGEGDHAGVVGGERRRGGLHSYAHVLGGDGEGFLQGAVTGHSAGKGDQGVAGLAGGLDRFFNEGIDDSSLERCADVGEVCLGIVELLELIKDGGLEAGEGKMKGRVLEMSAWEGEGFWVAFAGVLFDFGPTGIGELEHAADFVEGFAGGVVDGAADELVLSVRLDVDEHGVAAGDDKTEVGRDCSFFEERREKVPFHVVDSEEGFSGGGGETFGISESDEKGGSEAGAAGGGESGDVLEGDSGVIEGLLHEGANSLGVIAAGDLWDDAAVFAMDLDL